MIYTWALRGFLYQLSSLLLYHNLGDILAILAYILALALLETVAAMTVLIGLAAILPPGWLREGFGYKSFIWLLAAGMAAVALERYLTEKMTGLIWPAAGAAMIAGALISSILVLGRSPGLRARMNDLMERLSIFNWLYVPLGMLSLLVVLVRIIGWGG